MPEPENFGIKWVLDQCFDQPDFYRALCEDAHAALLARGCELTDGALEIVRSFSQDAELPPHMDSLVVLPYVRSIMEFMFAYTAPKPDDGGVVPVWGKTNTDV